MAFDDVHGALLGSWRVAEALGVTHSGRQIRFIGRAGSRAAFARKLMDHGISGGFRTPTALASYLAKYSGGTTRNVDEVAWANQFPEWLIATKERSDDVIIVAGHVDVLHRARRGEDGKLTIVEHDLYVAPSR